MKEKAKVVVEKAKKEVKPVIEKVKKEVKERKKSIQHNSQVYLSLFKKYEPLIDKIIKETERELKQISNEAKNYNDEIIKEVKVIVKENFEQIKSDIKDMESINYEFYPKIFKRLEELSVKTGEKLGTIFGLFLKETQALAKENKVKI